MLIIIIIIIIIKRIYTRRLKAEVTRRLHVRQLDYIDEMNKDSKQPLANPQPTFSKPRNFFPNIFLIYSSILILYYTILIKFIERHMRSYRDAGTFQNTPCFSTFFKPESS